MKTITRGPRGLGLSIFLAVLFGVENAIQLSALIAHALLVHQGAALRKNVLQGVPRLMEQMLDSGFGFPHDCGDLFCPKVIDGAEHEHDLLFKRQRFHQAGKTEVNMIAHLKLHCGVGMLKLV